MKHVILHYLVLLYLCKAMCATANRHRYKNRHYDINDFISQLLASSKFDELAEKLAEKAASKIMHMKEDQAPVERANDANEVQNNNESITQRNPTQSEEKHVKKHDAPLRKGFAGKINPQAVMNETISLSENLMLKYKLLKKKALEKINKKQRDKVSKNATNADRKENKTTGLADDEKNKKEGATSNQNATQHLKEDNKNKLFNENENLQDVDEKEAKRNSERNSFHGGTDGERNESDQKDDMPKKPSPVQHEREKNFRVEQNSGAEEKEQKAIQLDNGIKEEIPTSLDEQNRNYSPSEEKINGEAEVEINEDKPQNRGTEESIEDGRAVPYFRAQEDSDKVNIVPSRSDLPNPYGGIDSIVGSNDSGATGGRGSHELFLKDDTSTEKLNEEPTKLVIRKEGDKIYTYNQAPEYQDYHESMAKWRKEHPENPADFL